MVNDLFPDWCPPARGSDAPPNGDGPAASKPDNVEPLDTPPFDLIEGEDVPLQLELEQRIASLEQDNRRLRSERDSARDAETAKSAFLANMSHEIRTPMNGIIGMTELVLRTELTREQREYIELSRSSAETMLDLLNDILDFSKIEAGQLDLESIDFDLRQLLESTADSLAMRAHRKSLELTCRVHNDVPLGLVGDPNRLRQILMNLGANAIKFTTAGDIAIDCELESRDDREVELHFSVADSGIGIPEEQLDTIFESYRQADKSVGRVHGGTGLGLAISRQLTGMMGGRVWATSSEEGSTFHFTARFHQAEPANGSQFVPPAELAGVRTLVVDDSRVSRTILVDMLTLCGMDPEAAENGEEAMGALSRAAAAGRPFRLAVIDIDMPGMDGFEVGRRIQENSDLATDIVLLTSLGRKGDIKLCQDRGIESYLIKPVKLAPLVDVVTARLEAAGMSEAGPSATTATEAVAARGLNLLVVEDNMVNQKLAVKLLQRRGDRVTVADNGAMALEYWQNNSYDGILMDIQMPVMDGITAAKKIREIESGNGGHIPIIAMTAHAMKGDRETCLGAGMDEYITKPINVQDLYGLLEKVETSQVLTGEGEAPVPAEAEIVRPGGLNELLDYDAILEDFDGDASLMEEIFQLFIEESGDQRMRVSGAIASGDAGELERAAHSLKGSVGYFKVDELSDKAHRLEQLGAGGSTDGAPEIFSGLEHLIERVLADMQNYLGRQG